MQNNTLEIVFCVVMVLFAIFIGAVSTYLAINILIKFFSERKSDPARTLTVKEIENISLFLIGFTSSTIWISIFIDIIRDILGGR